jgi:hypothetical protein
VRKPIGASEGALDRDADVAAVDANIDVAGDWPIRFTSENFDVDPVMARERVLNRSLGPPGTTVALIFFGSEMVTSGRPTFVAGDTVVRAICRRTGSLVGASPTWIAGGFGFTESSTRIRIVATNVGSGWPSHSDAIIARTT